MPPSVTARSGLWEQDVVGSNPAAPTQPAARAPAARGVRRSGRLVGESVVRAAGRENIDLVWLGGEDALVRRRQRPCVSAVLTVLLSSCLGAGAARAAADGLAPPLGYVDRSGLSELIFWQGVNGLFAGGFLGTALFGKTIERECLDDDEVAGAPVEQNKSCTAALARGGAIPVVGLAAGVSLSFLLTRDKPVKTGDVILINRATMIGAMHGLMVPFIAGADPSDPDDFLLTGGFAFTGDVAGLGLGLYLASRHDFDPGKMSFLGTLHFATFLAAISVGSSFPEHNDKTDQRIIQGISLGLADAALVLALTQFDKIDIGRHRVFWLDTGAFIGMLGGTAMGALIGGDEERIAAIGGAAGMAAGLLLTYWSTKGDEKYRNRHEFSVAGIDFDAPTVGLSPRQTQDGIGLGLSFDVLRGRF
jgi:hypothetical protein